jgi:hypothetical protein
VEWLLDLAADLGENLVGLGHPTSRIKAITTEKETNISVDAAKVNPTQQSVVLAQTTVKQ